MSRSSSARGRMRLLRKRGGIFTSGETLVTDHTIANYAASTSPGYAKFGMSFVQGQVPAGYVVVLRDAGANLIAFQADQRVTWPDGSLKLVIAKIRDTQFTSLQSRLYGVYKKVGTWDNTTSITLANLLALADPRIKFTSVTDTRTMATGNADSGSTTTMVDAPRIGAGTNFFVGDELWFLNGPNIGLHRTITTFNTATGAFGFAAFPSAVASSHAYEIVRTATRGAGAALFVMATAAAITTRVTRIAGGPVYDEFEVRGMVKDGTTGAGADDAHWKVAGYIQAYKNGSGVVDTILFVGIPDQSWWSVADKRRINYDAEVLNGAVSIQVYNPTTMPALTTFGWSTLQHRYQAQWATVRLQDDDGHARPHCIVGTLPTLYSKPNRQYWIDSKLALPFNMAVSFPDPVTNLSYFGGDELPKDYTAFSSQGSRSIPDSTGGYMDRGLWPSVACAAFMRQGSLDYRYARVCAHAGLHYPMGFRSNNNRTRPSESADVANTPIALKMDTKSAGTYDFTADGMPAAVHAYADGTVTFNDGYVDHSGDVDAHCSSSPSYNASHANNHCEFIYLLEGERYMLERTFDLAIAPIVGNFGNEFGSRPRLFDYEDTSYRTAFSIPSTQWSGIMCRWPSNGRAVGWAQSILGAAAGLVPDGDVCAGYLRLLSQHAADYIKASMDFPAVPQSLKDAGVWADQSFTMPSPMMQTIIGMGTARAAMLTGDPDMLHIANIFSNHSLGTYRVGRPYVTLSYRGMYLKSNQPPEPWVATTNEFLARGMWNQLLTASLVGATGVFTFVLGGMTIHNGDVFYPAGCRDDGQAVPIPPELNYTQPYYAVQASGQTCKLSATPGGSAITYASNGNYTFGLDLADYLITPMNSSIYLPVSSDIFPSMHYCALILAFRAGCSNVIQADVDAAKAFIAPVVWDDIGCAWAMA